MAEKSNASARERDRQATQSGSSEEAEASSGASAGQPTSVGGKAETASKRDSTSSGKSDPAARSRNEHVSLRSVSSLERLRDRVETAAHELKRLREENQALTERVRELESRPDVEAQGTFLSLEHDPELLRRKINGFIEAIDRYLENERKRSTS